MAQLGDAGVSHFQEMGWRLVDEHNDDNIRRVILTTHEAGNAEVYFSWKRNPETGRWAQDEAFATLPGIGQFPIPWTFYALGSALSPPDGVQLLHKKIPREMRKKTPPSA